MYDERDVARFNEQDEYTLRFILHQQRDVKKAAAMVDASLKFRKQFQLNGNVVFQYAKPLIVAVSYYLHELFCVQMFTDLDEASFDRQMHDLGAIYYRNQDKDGHSICKFKLSYCYKQS